MTAGLLAAGVAAAAPAHAADFPPRPPDFSITGPDGCSTIPGGTMCLWIDDDPGRPPFYVKRIRVFTSSSAHPGASAPCVTHFELTYYRDGQLRTDLDERFGCAPQPPTGEFTDFAINNQVDLNQPICARTRLAGAGDPRTGDVCVTLFDEHGSGRPG